MPPSNVLEFPKVSRQMSLRDAYAAGLLAEPGTYDKLEEDVAAVRVMVGFLSSASIAFRVLGDAEASQWCSNGAAALIETPSQVKAIVAGVRDKLNPPCG